MADDEMDFVVPVRVVKALREHLQNVPQDAKVKQNIAGAYYDDELAVEQLKSLVGEEEAGNFRVLKDQLEG